MSLFVCLATAHPRSDHSTQVVCPFSLMVMYSSSCVCASPTARPSLHHTAEDPSCNHQPMVCGSSSSSSPALGACCTPFCGVTALPRTPQLFIAPPSEDPIHRITPRCRCVPVAHTPTDHATNRCLTAVCRCLNHLTLLPL
jgi:hypothetical protein